MKTLGPSKLNLIPKSGKERTHTMTLSNIPLISKKFWYSLLFPHFSLQFVNIYTPYCVYSVGFVRGVEFVLCFLDICNKHFFFCLFRQKLIKHTGIYHFVASNRSWETQIFANLLGSIQSTCNYLKCHD